MQQYDNPEYTNNPGSPLANWKPWCCGHISTGWKANVNKNGGLKKKCGKKQYQSMFHLFKEPIGLKQILAWLGEQTSRID